jgi:hypothetical protein
MASWGNQTGQQFIQPMDSNGEKLKVRSTSGAYSASAYRVEIEEASDGDRRALNVKGQAKIVQSVNSHALIVTGPTLVQALSGATNVGFRVEGDTTTQIDRSGAANPSQNALEVFGKTYITANSGEPLALDINGQVKISENATNIARFKNGVLGGARLDINTGPSDPGVRIGREGVSGNTVSLLGHAVEIGGSGSLVTLHADEGPVVVTGSQSPNLQVVGDLQVDNDIHTSEVDAIGLVNNSLILGGINNIGACRVGQFASQITLAENGSGALVSIRGPVLINDGDLNHQARLEVQGDISSHANLGCQGELDVGGPLDCEGDADFAQDVVVHGGLTVGTQQQSSNSTLHGNLTVNGDTTANGSISVQNNLDMNGDLNVTNRFKVTDAITCDANTSCTGDFNVDGETNLNNDVTMGSAQSPILANVNGDTNISGKLSVDGATSLNSELEAQDVARFNERSHHLNGVALTAPGTSFTGMIKQNSRIEFFLDGTLRFYIDSTGGHNA